MDENFGENVEIEKKIASCCPICGSKPDKRAKPFCSKRCSNIDLGYWLTEKYSIPAVEAAEDTLVENLITDFRVKDKG